MTEQLAHLIYWLNQAIRGGPESIESLMNELRADFDVARSPQSGSLLMTGAEQTLYEESSTRPWVFLGGYIDWTGLNFGAGENTLIRAYKKIVSGGVYRVFYAETFLAAALPVPILTAIPRNINTDCEPVKLYDVYGIKITATQAAIGGGWNTIPFEFFDGKV